MRDVLRLRPDETQLVGAWKSEGGKVIADDTTLRIRRLVREYLKPVAGANLGWERLFLDPSDGRLWEMTYPSGEMHGGGPPALRIIQQDVAREKYRLII